MFMSNTVSTVNRGSVPCPFPLDALPQAVHDFTVECAASLPVAPEAVAVPALVVVGAAIGNTRKIRLKESWSESTALWAAVVSPSGSKKSPALKEASQPLLKRDTKARRLWTSDVTVERLGGLLQQHPRGLFSYRDEFSAWVKSMNQYRGGKGADRPFYLSLYSGAPTKVDRTGTKKPIEFTLPDPCWSVVGGIPPDVLPDLEDENGREDGFLARLLFSWPDLVEVRWTDATVSPEVKAAYDNLIEELLAIPYDGKSVHLDLSPAAKECWIAWHDAHCAETENDARSSFQRATYNKLLGACARLALIHAVATNPQTATVELPSVESAIQLISYFKEQVIRVEQLFPHRGSEVERCRNEIRRKLSGSRLSKRILQKNSAYPAEIFNAAFESMLLPEIEINSDGMVSLEVSNNSEK